jgi:hypothetical protein
MDGISSFRLAIFLLPLGSARPERIVPPLVLEHQFQPGRVNLSTFERFFHIHYLLFLTHFPIRLYSLGKGLSTQYIYKKEFQRRFSFLEKRCERILFSFSPAAS